MYIRSYLHVDGALRINHNVQTIWLDATEHIFMIIQRSCAHFLLAFSTTSFCLTLQLFCAAVW